MHRIKEGLKDVTGTRPDWEDIDRVAQKVVQPESPDAYGRFIDSSSYFAR
jgi:hypothetical protein